MKKIKLQKIICSGMLLTTTFNCIPVHAHNESNIHSHIEIKSNFTLAKITSDDADDDFEEEKCGSITVKHIDVDTGKEIAPRDFYDDILLGDVEVYSRLNLPGYELQGSKKIEVVLTESNPNITVSFKYKNTNPPVTKPETNQGSTSGGTSSGNTSGSTSTQKPSSGSTSGNTSSGGTSNGTTTQKPSGSTSGSTSSGSTTQKPSTSTGTTTQKPTTSIDKEEVKTQGTVTIKYVDAKTGSVIKTIKKDKLALNKAHTFTAEDIVGYTLQGNKKEYVTLTSKKLTSTITFKYSKNETVDEEKNETVSDNKNETVKVETVQVFKKARMMEALNKGEDFEVESTAGIVSLSKDTLNSIVNNKAEDFILEFKNDLEDSTVINEIKSKKEFNVLSTFVIASNLNNTDVTGKITVTKEVDSKYNNSEVFVYTINKENSPELIDKQTVADGKLEFSTTLSSEKNSSDLFSSDYFISDVEIEIASQEVDNIVNEIVPETEVIEETTASTQETSKPQSMGIVIVAAVVSLGAAIAGIFAFKKKKANK